VYIAGIGVGGKGESDIASFAKSGKAEISFLCDVDDRRAAKSVANFPKRSIIKTSVSCSTKNTKALTLYPYPLRITTMPCRAMAAMERGKHVYVQKPLTHDIYEARMLTEAAKKYKVVTQMGNQGSSGDGVRQLVEWHNAGLLGDVHTVYCWTNRPVWPQGIEWSTKKPKCRKNLTGTFGWEPLLKKTM
jgi:predicted dehydrogenase